MRLNGDTRMVLHITANVIIALFHQQAMVAITPISTLHVYANNAIQMDGNHFAGDRKMVDSLLHTPSSLIMGRTTHIIVSANKISFISVYVSLEQ
jgi:hypothetical protein